MERIYSIDEADVQDKRVLVRVDFNVPIKEGKVTDDTRIVAALPTIRKLLEGGGKVILCSHLGRPAGTGYEEAYTLAPVAARLSELLGMDVDFTSEPIGPATRKKSYEVESGHVLLLDNLRFDKRETKNDPEFTQALALMADVYVNDAFGTAHRAHCSTAGVAGFVPSYAGYLLLNEVTTLSTMLEKPERPFVAILGGSKVSDKIKVIDNLLDKADKIVIGGGMCFTFLKAMGHEVGSSLCEDDMIDIATSLLDKAQKNQVDFILPCDFVCSDKFGEDGNVVLTNGLDIPTGYMGLDIGPESVARIASQFTDAKTIFWNGPMGVFEMKSFENGTHGVALAVSLCTGAQTVIGGGDSVAAVNKFGLADKMSFISTGGGAAMELVEGKFLPGVEALFRE